MDLKSSFLALAFPKNLRSSDLDRVATEGFHLFFKVTLTV